MYAAGLKCIYVEGGRGTSVHALRIKVKTYVVHCQTMRLENNGHLTCKGVRLGRF
jgi:hypothetical protein